MSLTRRTFLTGLSGLTLYSIASSARSRVTPWQSLGPFYPQKLPVDSDADLTFVVGKNDQATGQFTRLSGRVTDQCGAPIKNARVEIWQCDANKVYHHPAVFDAAKADPNFLGFGAQVSDEVGAFSFTTIVPVGYFGRPPHIHVKLWINGAETLTTQVYLFGMGGARSRQMVPRGDSDEFEAKFDFVIG